VQPIRKSHLARLALGAALLAPAWSALGCGGTVIDTSKIEAQAKSELEKNLPARPESGKSGKELQKELGISVHEEITSVDCPSGVDVNPGSTFDCTVTFGNGNKGTETFRIENKDADVTQISLKRAESG
jgi:hypothetical protein